MACVRPPSTAICTKRSSTLPVEVVPRPTPNEERAHAADHSSEGPDVRPLPSRVAQSGTMRHQVGKQDVVDVAPVVHHEYNANVFECLLIQARRGLSPSRP